MHLKGYVSVRSPVPVSVQNLVLRDYCARNGHQLSLADVEFLTDFKMLDALLASLDHFDGICAYSMWITPWDVPLTKFSDRKEIHFALENLKLPDDAGRLLDLYHIRKVME